MKNETEQTELHTETEFETGYDETGFTNVLKDLEAEDAESGEDFDPDTAPQYQTEAEKEREAEAEAEREQKRHQQAVETVIQALGMYETGIQLGAHKRFTLSEDEKHTTAEYLAPAVVKYLPDGFDIHSALFGKYKAEIMGIIGLYMLSKSTVASVKELRAQDKQAAEDAKRAKQRQKVQANDAEPEQAAA
ncbi:MAG: hypothetical protein VX061_07585 [Pseudomonadota bacterium]|jgi:hypothetical protein|nr:hypothetical protein [Pseudomonadota bacterium]